MGLVKVSDAGPMALSIRWQVISNGETGSMAIYLRKVAELDIVSVSLLLQRIRAPQLGQEPC